MDTTYNVKIWKTSVYRGKRKSSYTVRWELEGREWRQPFATSALADSFRSELVSATRRGEAFSLTTGRPVSHQSGASAASWYEFSIRFADAQWRRTSGNNRKNVAKALMTTTIALLRAPVPSRFAPVDVRTALREFAYNTRRRPEAPPDVEQILQWVERNSLSMATWEDPRKVDEVLHALATKLDGTTAAASSVKRNRRILNVALEYAVTHKVLSENPLPKGRGTTPKTSSAVDKRSLINPAHAAGLLSWIWNRPRGGQRLHAFFAAMYYAGPRPEEVVAMRVLDVQLPDADADDQWGELLFHTAQPEVGKRWTDSGEVHEERGLKGRAKHDTRVVPCRPALTRILREHIEAEELKPGDLLFPGEKGDLLSGSVFRRAWRTAREKVLTPEEYVSPLARRVYDLRHTCLTTWLNNGVPPAQVAEWAGNSVPVLLATYARCISGQLRDHQARIEASGDLPDLAGER
ncbi:tyrosine-type recombinase/integrase [Streptomyces lunaelactis]|uniref:tyrosine-type recombinase/integrase n=1 Tax=Streptomyces lunaelactis TaxID=1535768 RepID=UPI00158586E6|nr:tyrosine-type recombinase/integrase [Streptomyces lunaelactis]NUK71106.1 tyrosine-type recombinase/integrase [Streptomyces lunaelactis]NUK79682.1 tyrosine-type recombinase/integrase [Streptomyces lunaelactis]